MKNGENGLLVNAFIRITEVKVTKNTFCENEFNGLLENRRFNNFWCKKMEKLMEIWKVVWMFSVFL